MKDAKRPSKELEYYKTTSAKEVEIADTSLNEDDMEQLVDSEDNDQFEE